MIHNVCFSARGTTKCYADLLASVLGSHEDHAWLKEGERKPLSLGRDDVLVLSMPVYGGFIPAPCLGPVKALKGDGSAAIIIAVYGNRHYDDALTQMKDLLEGQGFCVIAAAAFIAGHSIFTSVAKGRPDDVDKQAASAFASRCAWLIEDRTRWEGRGLVLPSGPGKDSSSFMGTPFHPTGDGGCTYCLRCVRTCPVHAINPAVPTRTSDWCISCGACIEACPVHSRAHRAEGFEAAEAAFASKCAARREAEVFFVG